MAWNRWATRGSWSRNDYWDFILQFPTPEKLAAARQRSWDKFLHTQKLWRPQTAPQRLEILQNAGKFCVSAPVISAKSLLAVSPARVSQFGSPKPHGITLQP
jgi:hypothetical protein